VKVSRPVRRGAVGKGPEPWNLAGGLPNDERLRHRLNKGVANDTRDVVPQMVTTADQLLARIPEGRRDFDRAKAAVMEAMPL
jgi:hypothetical protein